MFFSKERLIPIVLSVLMIVAFMPSMAFAAGNEDIGSSVEEEITTEAEGTVEAGVVNKETAPVAVPAESELEEVTIGSGTYSAVVQQDKINYTKVNISIPGHKNLKSAGITDVQVKATLNYDGKVTWSKSKTKAIKDIAAADGKYSMNFANYGKFTVSVIFKKGSKAYKTVSKAVNIVAEEYNLAPIVATYPVTLFTLAVQNICKKGDGTPVPTFISLQRPDAYNWDNLPENCYWQPNLTLEQVKKQTNFDSKTTKFADYIADLYKANPAARFNLYINDAYPKYELQLLCANGIPSSQYTVTLLSDGTGTYSHYIDCFSGDNRQAKYDEMAAAWATVKSKVTNEKKYSLEGLPYYSSSNYAVVLTNEDENTTWWVGRKNNDTFTPTGASDDFKNFTTQYVTNGSNRVAAKNTWTMCNALTDEQKEAFKALYHFNGSMFAEAEKTGKNAMMILGSRVNSEPNFGEFSAYAKFLMNQYGHEKFVYYYKGHPGTPTKLYPEKQKQLDELGITDVESSIAAELILFFYPNLYMAGYSSSTFNSVEKPEMATGVFGKTRAQAEADTGVGELARNDTFQFYMSQMTSGQEEYPGIKADHDNYLIEFQNAYLQEQGNKYDVAVYDYTDDIIYYYKSGETKTLTKVVMGKVVDQKLTLDYGKKTVTANWKGLDVATGYQLKYKSSPKGAWKTKSSKTNSMTFTGLKNGQTFEYKVCAVMNVDGKDYYGEYSGVSRAYVATTSIKSLKSKSKKKFKVKVKKVSGATGYQYLYATNKSFKKAVKVSVKGAKKTKKEVKKLSKGKRYYVKVRPYKKVGSKVYYGQYSAIKSVKVK